MNSLFSVDNMSSYEPQVIFLYLTPILCLFSVCNVFMSAVCLSVSLGIDLRLIVLWECSAHCCCGNVNVRWMNFDSLTRAVVLKLRLEFITKAV